MNTDSLLRGSFKDIDVRFILAKTTQTVTTGIFTHNTDPVASHIFGSSITCAALLSSLLTDRERYSVQWHYEGLIGGVVVDVNAEGHVRGIPKNTSLMSAMTKADLYGEKGHISIIKSVEGKILSSGTSETAMLDIADDVSFHFSTSDQIETELVSVVNFNADPENPVQIAGGFMMQALPGCDLKLFEKMRNAIKETSFLDILTQNGNDEKKLHQVLKYLYEKTEKECPEDARQIASYEFGRSPVYQCTCSKEKMQNALRTIDPAELKELLKQPEGIKLKCDFCHTEYIIKEL